MSLPDLCLLFRSRLGAGSLQGASDGGLQIGNQIAGVTRGKDGAMFYDGTNFYSQGIKPANAVDTMGAGDSFIAGFLTRYEDTGKMEEALDYAAERAALTCGVRGGFGHPHPMEGQN